MTVDGRLQAGYVKRFCPVCNRNVGTYRKPPNTERGEIVVYLRHQDTIGSPCEMGGKGAALAAVAFMGRGR